MCHWRFIWLLANANDSIDLFFWSTYPNPAVVDQFDLTCICDHPAESIATTTIAMCGRNIVAW